MQAARYLVGFVVELTARVKLGHDNLESAHALFGMQICGDSASIVNDFDNVVRLYDNRDVVAVTHEGLIDCIVDDFVHQVMQADGIRGTDIHARPFPDMFDTVQDLYVFRGIALHRVSPPKALTHYFSIS